MLEISFDNIQNVQNLKFGEDLAELRLKICLLRQYESFLFALYNSSDDSNFWKKIRLIQNI